MMVATLLELQTDAILPAELTQGETVGLQQSVIAEGTYTPLDTVPIIDAPILED